MYVCLSPFSPFTGGLETSGQRVYLYYCKTRCFLQGLDNFVVLTKKWVFGSLQTSLLCRVGELAGGGSVAVAVGVSDR